MSSEFYLTTADGDTVPVCVRTGVGGGQVSYTFYGYDMDAPLVSWAQWRRVLLAVKGEIWNEWGERMIDAGDFVRAVDATPHDVRTLRSSNPAHWVCDDGFTFGRGTALEGARSRTA